LPAEIQLAIRAKKISMGHARALLSLENQKRRLKLCNLIIEKDLSVRDTENRIRKINELSVDKKITDETSAELDESYFRLLDFLGKYFNNNISLKRDEKTGTGSITIRFKDDNEVKNFITAVEKTNL
jgi:ParB family chromosome partitioning protein